MINLQGHKCRCARCPLDTREARRVVAAARCASYVRFTLQGHPWGKAAATPLSGPLFGVRALGPHPLRGRGAQSQGTGLRCSVSSPSTSAPFHASPWGPGESAFGTPQDAGGSGPHGLRLASRRAAFPREGCPGPSLWAAAHSAGGHSGALLRACLSGGPQTAGRVRTPRPAPLRPQQGVGVGGQAPPTPVWPASHWLTRSPRSQHCGWGGHTVCGAAVRCTSGWFLKLQGPAPHTHSPVREAQSRPGGGRPCPGPTA